MEPNLLAMLPSWHLAMTSENKSKTTIQTYLAGVMSYLNWCEGVGVTPRINRDDAQQWIVDMLDGGAQPTTAKTRQHGLKMFAKWLADEGEIDSNPLIGIAPPKLPRKVTEALTDVEVAAMIRACQGKTMVDRRDEALLRFMVETGARASEVVSVRLPDVNLTTMTAIIREGKGRKGRVVPFSTQCATALDRYIRARRRLPNSTDDGPLWIGSGGRSFGYYALRLALQARAAQAGVTTFHLHKLRHTAATRWLRSGGSEAGLMAVAGWSDRAMLDRYTAASAAERATAEAQRLGLGEF